MANRIQLRRGTSTEWIQFNPVLAEAELGVEVDTGRIKIGDGATPWQLLKYERPLESVDATPSTLVLRDSNSSIKTKNITLSTGGKLFGVATSAEKLSTSRLVGASTNSDLTGSASFDGSANLDINFQLKEIFTGSTGISYTKFNVDSKGRITSAQNPTTLSGYGIVDGQPLNGVLTSISAVGTGLGFLVKVDTNSGATNNTILRSLEVTSGQLTITNPTGTAGNPILGLDTTTVTAGTYNTESLTSASGSQTVNASKFTVDAYGRITSATVVPIAIASETQKGLASFNSEDFDVSAAGVVTIADQGVDNNQLQNAKITLGTTDYVLGSTYTDITTITNLTVDGNTLHVDSVNNRVGFGTLTPTTTVDVVGNVRATEQLRSAVSGSRPIYTAFGVTSTAESGTAPFQVTSSRKVSLLNCDLLDDLTSLDFLRRTDDYNNADNEGNRYVASNLWIDATTVTVQDPIIDIGGGSKGAALTGTHTSDRGLTLQYYSTGSSRRAFVGWDTSSGAFVLARDVSLSSEVVSGTYSALDLGATTLRNGSLTIKTGGTNAGTLAATGETTTFTVDHTTGNTSISGTLGVTGNVNINTDKFNIIASSGNTSIAGTLDVANNVFINTNKFMITASNGNTSIAGTLGVTGATTLSSTLGVTGVTTLSGNLIANANSTLGDASADTLTVNATSTFNAPVTLSGSNNLDVGGNITVTGNLTVNGTTTTVNSTTITIDDPIITLGGDTTPTSDDNKDRGVEFRYYDTQARLGFFGWDDSYSTLAGTTGGYRFLYNATNTSEVFSGTDAGVIAGNLSLTTGTESSSATTGDLVVSGGVGIGKVLNLTGNFNINTNKFNVIASSGNTSIAGTLGVTGATTLSSTLGVTGATTLSSTLGVTGVASITNSTDSTATNNGALVVTGGAGIGSQLRVGGNTTLSGTLGVTGATTLSSTLSVTDNATFNKNLTLVGSNTAATEYFKIQNGSSSDKFVVDSSSGNTDIQGTLDVLGNVAINTNKFNITSSSGNTSIAGTLGVTGATTLSSTLGVTGNTTLSGTLGVTNLATFSGGVTVSGSTSTSTEFFRINDGSTTKFEVDSATGNTSIAGTLGVTGATTLSSTLALTGNFNINTNKFSVIASSGNTTIAGTLDVTSDFAINTNRFTVSAANGNTSVAGTLGVTGVTTVSGLLNANGGIAVDTNAFTVADTTGNTSIAGTLGVTGATTLSSTLGVTGATTLTGLLNANGGIAVDTNAFTVAGDGTGNTSIAGTLSVTGNTTLTGDLAVNGADITTTSTGTATLFNTNATTLNVGGAATSVSIGAATGTATINNANTIVTGDLAVNGGDITSSSTTFNLVNGTVTTLNIGGASTSITIGSTATNATTTFNKNVVVSGDLTVNGTTTTINSTVISVDDKNIELGSVASPTDVTADGGGITLKGATDKTFSWASTGGSWTSSENLNLLTGKSYRIAGNEVLTSTTLGSGVTASSLTSVGTLTSLTVSGTATFNGNVTLGDATTDTVTFTSRIASDIIASTNNTRSLGATGTRWSNVWSNQVDGGNLRITGNILSSQNTNGNITLTPNGAGIVETLADVNFGSSGDLSTLTVVGQLNADNIRVDGNTISSTDTNGNIVITPNGTGKITTAKDVDITSTLSVTGQLNVDNLRIDNNQLSSTSGEIDIRATGNNRVIIGNVTTGTTIRFDPTIAFNVGSGVNVSDAQLTIYDNIAARNNMVIDGNLTIRGSLTTTGSGGQDVSYITYNNSAGLSARTASVTSNGTSTVYNLDCVTAANGGTINTALGVKYLVHVTRTSDSKRSSFEMLAVWDNDYGSGEIHTTEYTMINPSNLQYSYDVAWVDGGGNIGIRPTLRITNIPNTESVTVKIFKTYFL